MTYQVNVSQDGKLVLPADVAKALGLSPGDRLTVAADGKTFDIKTFAEIVREGQEKFRAMIKTPFTVDEFIAEKRAEAEHE